MTIREYKESQPQTFVQEKIRTVSRPGFALTQPSLLSVAPNTKTARILKQEVMGITVRSN
jgi:hypothetical protein